MWPLQITEWEANQMKTEVTCRYCINSRNKSPEATQNDLIAACQFPLHANFRYQPTARSQCRYKSKNQFSAGNGEQKLSGMNVSGLFAISSLQREPHVPYMEKPRLVALKGLSHEIFRPVFGLYGCIEAWMVNRFCLWNCLDTSSILGSYIILSFGALYTGTKHLNPWLLKNVLGETRN